MHTHSDAHTTLTHTAVTDKGNATQLQRSTDLHYQMVVPIGSPDTHTLVRFPVVEHKYTQPTTAIKLTKIGGLRKDANHELP